MPSIKTHSAVRTKSSLCQQWAFYFQGGLITYISGEEWEKELQQELQDYELVGGEGDEDNLADNDELEREILQQIEREAGTLS
ncbi:hypothetical protein ElyMa_003016000 [Elysia marginata]|uniref:Uncharacterized protein n=1 Tax=Elysia marginata TaxID=1093978 RepID=A0AAV4IEU3_9GAST|nr:hypothetical protein ElyMa_003016000 [Elysia marginata]